MIVYAGVDYERILRQAEKEADVILWDGGNNDTPFYHSDLEIVVVDPHRPGHELAYYPGEREPPPSTRRGHQQSRHGFSTGRGHRSEKHPLPRKSEGQNPSQTACRVTVSDPASVKGRRVLVVEDGPTLTHGEMPYGAGVVAARQCAAAELIDPRPYAVGSIRSTFEKYAHLTSLLPAMGYSTMQMHELEETINRVPCDLVLVATPIFIWTSRAT